MVTEFNPILNMDDENEMNEDNNMPNNEDMGDEEMESMPEENAE